MKRNCACIPDRIKFLKLLDRIQSNKLIEKSISINQPIAPNPGSAESS